MQDVNKKLQNELSVLINHIKTNTDNKKKAHKMKTKKYRNYKNNNICY